MPHGNVIDYLASVQDRELGLTLRFVGHADGWALLFSAKPS
jgi:hypothetical protein